MTYKVLIFDFLGRKYYNDIAKWSRGWRREMVVLLIGGGSVLMNTMIDKLNKNGHRVYLLTGRKENRFSYRRVFEKYHFTYDSGSIKDILDTAAAYQ